MLERKKDGVAEWGFTEELVVLVERGVLIKFLEIEPRHWNEIREIPVKFWFETIRLGMGWLSVSLWAGALGSDGRHKGIEDLRQRKRFLPLRRLVLVFQFFKTESPIFTFESILRIYDYLVSDYYYSVLMFAPSHRPPADVQSYELHVVGWLVDGLVDWLTQAAGWSTGLIDLSKIRKIFRLY